MPRSGTNPCRAARREESAGRQFFLKCMWMGSASGSRKSHCGAIQRLNPPVDTASYRQDGKTMETTVSTKGQVVLPQRARRKLGLLPGTKLECRIDGGSVVLTPKGVIPTKTRLVRDKTDGGPTVTSDQVRAALADFP